MSGCGSCAVSSGFFLIVSFALEFSEVMILVGLDNETGIRMPEIGIKQRFL